MIAVAVLYVGYLFAYNVHWYTFHLGDAHWRWQECAYVLHRINPFDVMQGTILPIESIGALNAEGGTVPWAYVLGNLINPGFLPYEIARYYIIALNIMLPLLTWGIWANYLLKKIMYRANGQLFYTQRRFLHKQVGQQASNTGTKRESCAA